MYFGISESVLKRIEADHPSVRRRKQEVCAAFIRSNTSASWEIVIYALNEMDEKRLARKIERKYSVKQKPGNCMWYRSEFFLPIADVRLKV